MSTTQTFWRSIIRDFNTVGQLRPEDVARFFVDRKEDDPTRSTLRRLKLSMQDGRGLSKPYKALLTGHIGSGKSVELMRLGQELTDDFFVVWFDAGSTLVTETANHFDVLLAMGLAVYAAAQAASLDPEARYAKEFVHNFAKIVRKFAPRKGFSLKVEQIISHVAATALGAPDVPSTLRAAISGLPPLELNISDDSLPTLELPVNRRAVIGPLNEIIAGVERKAEKPVLIITDGLDHVPSARAWKFFADSALLTEPACALVYAAPVEFYYRLRVGREAARFDGYYLMPNVLVHQRPPTGDEWKAKRRPNEQGLRVMRRIVARRLEARDETASDIITPGAVDLLALASGGVIRELVSYVRDAATFAQLLEKVRIDEAIAQNVIDQQRSSFATRLTVRHLEVLRQILQRGMLNGGQQQSVEDELLHNSYLLSYQENRHVWFDTHPNILSLL